MAYHDETIRIILIGCGATLVMDLWLAVLKQLGVPTLNFAFIGRWAGHLIHGQFAHTAIAKSPRVQNERLLGWIVHYVVGIAFAALLIGVFGSAWARSPTVGPAVFVGVFTVVFPLFVMQPAMGSGFASSKTPSPMKNCIRSIVNHAVFGFGLFLSACLIEWIST